MAVVAFFIFLPVMLIVMILLLITGHRRLFFVQKRVGLNEKIFYLIKFLTFKDSYMLKLIKLDLQVDQIDFFFIYLSSGNPREL